MAPWAMMDAAGVPPTCRQAGQYMRLKGTNLRLIEHANKTEALGFFPHGAERNLSRTPHTKHLAAEFGADARGRSPNSIQAISGCETGLLDILERRQERRPGESQIRKPRPANIVDRVMPLRSIMAGEMNWNRKR